MKECILVIDFDVKSLFIEGRIVSWVSIDNFFSFSLIYHLILFVKIKNYLPSGILRRWIWGDPLSFWIGPNDLISLTLYYKEREDEGMNEADKGNYSIIWDVFF